MALNTLLSISILILLALFTGETSNCHLLTAQYFLAVLGYLDEKLL